MKDFLRSMLGGAVGAAILLEIGALACCIVRHERRMMSQRGREDEVPH